MASTAILGYGTVGAGVYEVLRANAKVIEKNAKQPITVKHILDIRDFPGNEAEKLITHDFQDILEDDSVEVVIETMGGLNPAYTFVRSALEKGKSVVTSNKELVARHGAELLSLARGNSVSFLFDASVCGGIPVIRTINNAVTSDEITGITGILNGTTNYILTKMTQHGEDFNTALKAAQDLGYAEKNPGADVEGHDTCRKLAILLSLITGKNVCHDDIHTDGISRVTTLDIDIAASYNCTIKLVASASIKNGAVYANVAPAVLPDGNPLAAVNDAYNGILINGAALGQLMLYGMGAGKEPTATAVIADVIEAVNKQYMRMPFWTDGTQQVEPYAAMLSKRLVVFKYKDLEGAKQAVKEIFGDSTDCLASERHESIMSFKTDELTFEQINGKLDGLASHGAVDAVLSTYMVY